MAYSGTRTFNLNIEEIIKEAYERCGLEVRSGYDLKTARRSLNLMFSDWANRGLNLWTIDYATQTMTAGTNFYTIDQKLVESLSELLNFWPEVLKLIWKFCKINLEIFLHSESFNW